MSEKFKQYHPSYLKSFKRNEILLPLKNLENDNLFDIFLTEPSRYFKVQIVLGILFFGFSLLPFFVKSIEGSKNVVDVFYLVCIVLGVVGFLLIAQGIKKLKYPSKRSYFKISIKGIEFHDSYKDELIKYSWNNIRSGVIKIYQQYDIYILLIDHNKKLIPINISNLKNSEFELHNRNEVDKFPNQRELTNTEIRKWFWVHTKYQNKI